MKPVPLQPVPDDEMTEALAAILRTSGSGPTREASCYLATISAEHLANRLAVSGYVLMRPAPPELRLDV